MKVLQRPRSWNTVAVGAMATVLLMASPASAADSTTTVQASPSSAVVGEPVVLTANVSCPGDPSGGLGMTFFAGGDLLDTVPVSPSGEATHTTSFTTVGTYTITAAYNGNENCNASNNTTTVTVSEAPPTPPTPPDNGRPCILLCGLTAIGGGIGTFENINIRNDVR